MWMPRLAVAVLAAALVTAGAGAQQTPAVAVQVEEADASPDLADLLWIARPLVIFADSASDPRFLQQMRMLEGQLDDLTERDVVVLTDTDPDARGPLRQQLRPRGFGLVLIDLDGSIAQRRPAPTSARELINLIDRMPSRRQETGSRRQ